MRDGGFTALVETDILARDVTERGLERVCATRREPIKDRGVFQAPSSVLAPIFAGRNAAEWLEPVESAAIAAGFDTVEDRADTTDPLSVRLPTLYAGIDLEATSEFGTLDEYSTDSDRELRDLLGSEVETVPDPVAYPELQ